MHKGFYAINSTPRLEFKSVGWMEKESVECGVRSCGVRSYGVRGMENVEYDTFSADFSANLVRYTALKPPRPMSSFHRGPCT